MFRPLRILQVDISDSSGRRRGDIGCLWETAKIKTPLQNGNHKTFPLPGSLFFIFLPPTAGFNCS